MNEEDTLLTFKDAMKYLRVSRSTIYRLMEDGTLIGNKVGSSWRFWLKDVRACVGKVPTVQDNSLQSWHERRMERYVRALVEQEQPTSEEERQTLSQQWYEQGEDAVIEAMRYTRRKARSA